MIKQERLPTRDDFTNLMHLLFVEFPDMNIITPTDRDRPGTLDVWWNTCKTIPLSYLAAGVQRCLTIRKFYPSPKLHDLLQASVGDQYRIVPFERRPFGEITLDHILAEYGRRYEQAALPPPDQKKLPTKQTIGEIIVALRKENAELKTQNASLVQEVTLYQNIIAELRSKSKSTRNERRDMVLRQAKLLGITHEDMERAKMAAVKSQEHSNDADVQIDR